MHHPRQVFPSVQSCVIVTRYDNFTSQSKRNQTLKKKKKKKKKTKKKQKKTTFNLTTLTVKLLFHRNIDKSSISDLSSPLSKPFYVAIPEITKLAFSSLNILAT